MTEDEKLPVDFDSVLDQIGSFGKYQKILYFSICFPVILTTCVALAVVFSVAIPKSRCFIPNCDNSTNPEYSDAFTNGFSNFTIPEKQGQCHHFQFLNQTETCSVENFNSKKIESCSEGQIYDHSYYGTTVVSDFQLSCGQEWKIPLVESMSFVGIMISALSFGVLADFYGRKIILMICLLTTVISGICVTFSTNFWMYLVFQTLGTFGSSGCFQTGFILALESVGKSHRVMCGIIIEYFFVGGEILLTLIAMISHSWQWLTAFPSIFLGILLLTWPIVPESTRWLLTKGKNRQAEAAILTMAKVNKVGPDFDLDNHRISQNRQNAPVENLLNVIKNWTLGFRFLNTCFCWLTVTMVYYGLSLNATNLAGNPFLNFILVSLVEVPGYSASYFTMEKFGRRKSTALSLFLGSFCCLISAILTNYSNLTILTTITFLLGKLGVTWTFGNIYIYTSELFPTSTRTACVGACSTSGRIGSILSPYIASLALTLPWLPMFIFGFLALLSGIFVYFFLPETLGRPLPETVAEAANFQRVSRSEQDENTPLLS